MIIRTLIILCLLILCLLAIAAICRAAGACERAVEEQLTERQA